MISRRLYLPINSRRNIQISLTDTTGNFHMPAFWICLNCEGEYKAQIWVIFWMVRNSWKLLFTQMSEAI